MVKGNFIQISHTFVSPSADSKGAVVSYWRKCVHGVQTQQQQQIIQISCEGGVKLKTLKHLKVGDWPAVLVVCAECTWFVPCQ